jgi:hypothetical protein
MYIDTEYCIIQYTPADNSSCQKHHVKGTSNIIHNAEDTQDLACFSCLQLDKLEIKRSPRYLLFIEATILSCVCSPFLLAEDTFDLLAGLGSWRHHSAVHLGR